MGAGAVLHVVKLLHRERHSAPLLVPPLLSRRLHHKVFDAEDGQFHLPVDHLHSPVLCGQGGDSHAASPGCRATHTWDGHSSLLPGYDPIWRELPVAMSHKCVTHTTCAEGRRSSIPQPGAGAQGMAAPAAGTFPLAALTWLHPLHEMRQPGSQSLKVRWNCIFPEETL